MTALRAPRRRPGAGRSGLWPTAAAVPAGIVLAVLAGATEPRYGTVSVAICGAGLVLILISWAARAYGSGVIIGLLVLGAVDALPGPNYESVSIIRTAHLTDALAIVLAAVLIRIAVVHPQARTRATQHETFLRVWSALLLGFWLVAGARAWLGQSVPLLNGLFWGRAFFYLAVLPPLFVRALMIPRVRRTTLVVTAIGVGAAALAQVATVATGHTIGLFVHLTRVANAEGLIRLYSGADWIIPAGVPFGLGLVLLSAGRRERLMGVAVFLCSFSALAVELTRALYIGMVIGLAVTLMLWFAVGDASGRAGRRRGVQVVATLLLMLAALIFVRPAVISGSVVNGVVVRATSVFADLANPGNTVDPNLRVRQLEAADLRAYLGSSWLFGKGFLDPSYYYVPRVFGGSIMNPDVGYLSAVMTLGVAGTAVLYAAFLYFALVLAYLRVKRRLRAGWLAFGSLAWLVMAMIASVTLAIMLSPAGAVPSAAILAVACVCAGEAKPPAPNRPFAPLAPTSDAPS